MFAYENTFMCETCQATGVKFQVVQSGAMCRALILYFRFVFIKDLPGELTKILHIIYFCGIKILCQQVQRTQTADRLSLWDTDACFHFRLLDQMEFEGMLCIFSQCRF